MTWSAVVGTKQRGIYAVLDLAIVASFVLIGRDTHNESLGVAEVLRTGAPFVLALVGAWLTPLVHRKPSGVRSGLAAGLITTALGIYFRTVVFGEGSSGLFPVVTGAYLTGLMLVPRLITAARSRARRAVARP